MHRLLCVLILCVVEVRAQEALPRDVYPDSRNRLPAVSAANSPAPLGVAAIRLHGSGATVRCAATATRLSAFNQQMPPGWKQFLPLPFTPPDDIYPDSRSRLPLIRSQAQNTAAAPGLYTRNLAPEGTGPAHIRRHQGSRQSLESSVGRRLMGLAILVTAREHDAQYDWTMNEVAALKDGLEPAIIEQVRHRQTPTGLADKEAVLIEFGRELFRKHTVSPQTYARALKIFGERDLVDMVELMAQHAGDSTLLTAFDQHLPAGQRPLLPTP